MVEHSPYLVVSVLPLVSHRVVSHAVHGHVHAHVDGHGGEVVGGGAEGARHRPGREGRVGPAEAVHGVERSVVRHVGVLLGLALLPPPPAPHMLGLTEVWPGVGRGLVWQLAG